MEFDFGFKVCRICLRPNLRIILNPLFEGDGKLAKMFRVITRIEPSKDINKHEIVICDKCTVALKRAYELKLDAETAELHYFEYERKMYESEQLKKIKDTNLDMEATARIGQDTTGQQADDQTITEQVVQVINSSDSSQEIITDARANNEHENRESATASSSLNQVQQTLMQNTTKRTKRYNCGFKNCEKSFTDNYKMNRHLKRVHSNLRPYKCPCGKSYKAKPNLRRHISAIHGKRVKFSCDLCCYQTSYKQTIRRHLMVHIKLI